MSDDRDYSNEPQSFTERRAIQERKASIMTPRDALIMALRELDAGTFDPDALIVVASVRNPDRYRLLCGFAALLSNGWVAGGN